MLLDFGSARQALTREHSRLAPMYTPGFAAPEQYRRTEPLGPWTDIYGIGASMYACIAGCPPVAADQREKDPQPLNLHGLFGDRYSPELLDIIDYCLRLDHEHRPQSVHKLQKALLEPASPPKKKGSVLHAIKRKWFGLTRMTVQESR